MATAGYRGGAGASASAGRMGEAARAAERAAQHGRPRLALPLLTAAAAVVGWAAVGTLSMPSRTRRTASAWTNRSLNSDSTE